MTSQAGHLTPLPWRLYSPGEPETSVFEDGKTIVADVGGSTLAVARTHYFTDERARANAAFIVKAVNAHDDLVKALRDLLRFNEDLCADIGVSKHYPSAERARAALAKLSEGLPTHQPESTVERPSEAS